MPGEGFEPSRGRKPPAGFKPAASAVPPPRRTIFTARGLALRLALTQFDQCFRDVLANARDFKVQSRPEIAISRGKSHIDMFAQLARMAHRHRATVTIPVTAALHLRPRHFHVQSVHSRSPRRAPPMHPRRAHPTGARRSLRDSHCPRATAALQLQRANEWIRTSRANARISPQASTRTRRDRSPCPRARDRDCAGHLWASRPWCQLICSRTGCPLTNACAIATPMIEPM
jgi:hypothetical protein